MDKTHMRRHTRLPVRWKLQYSGDDFIADGTLIDVTAIGWKLAGPMPVRPGMSLRLRVFAPQRKQPLWIEHATVVWVRGQVFGIEINQVAQEDQSWMDDYLSESLGLWLVAPPPKKGAA